MEYITITSDSYENAVSEARVKYGPRVRIISRRDYTVGGGLFARKRNRSEIVCYLSDTPAEADDKASNRDLKEFEKEARTPNPDTLSVEEKLQTVLPSDNRSSEREEAEKLLDLNDIAAPLKSAVLDGFECRDDLTLELGERIVSRIQIDYEGQAHPRKYMVFLGPTGNGRTSTLLKTAYLYRSVGRSVAVISLDCYKAGAYEEIKAFTDASGIESSVARDEDELESLMARYSSNDLVLVDTMGTTPSDSALCHKLDLLLSHFDRAITSFVMVFSATCKSVDLEKHYRRYTDIDISSLIVTKLDESESIGAALTFAFRTGRPLLFATFGQKIPETISKVTQDIIIEHLAGFRS